MHDPFEQQPFGQLAGVQPLHCCVVHVCGEGHVWQAMPKLPHAAGTVPGWHWLF